jgi:p-aminobenzoyl-glutamate transporter AbgT
VVLILTWSVLLVIFWVAGIPLGSQSSYTYP